MSEGTMGPGQFFATFFACVAAFAAIFYLLVIRAAHTKVGRETWRRDRRVAARAAAYIAVGVNEYAAMRMAENDEDAAATESVYLARRERERLEHEKREQEREIDALLRSLS